MPWFYFNIRDDDGLIPDLEGMDCRNLLAAKREAEASARELLVHDVRAHRKLDHRRIEVCDEAGTIVAAFKLRDLLN